MLKKYSIFLLAFVFAASLLLLSACDNNQNDVGGPFIGGIKGLSMQFIENAPPVEIMDSGLQPFSVGVRILNEGEADVKSNEAIVWIDGFSPTLFDTTTEHLVKYLEIDLMRERMTAEDSSITKGGSVTEFFPTTGDLVYKHSVAGSQEQTIRANLCYLYMTQATSSICFDSVLSRPAGEGICSLSGPKQVFSSSGPVSVTSLSQQPVGNDRIRIEFKVEQVGRTGKVIKPFLDNFIEHTCMSSTQHDYFANEDIVFVRVDPAGSLESGSFDCRFSTNPEFESSEVSKGNYGIGCVTMAGKSTCRPNIPNPSREGFVRLTPYSDGGKYGNVVCDYYLGSEDRGNFITQLNIQVFYQYKESATKSVLIKHTDFE